MHITSIITGSMAALSAGALAFPTAPKTDFSIPPAPENITFDYAPSRLEKRGKGTVAGFWGANCFGPVVPGTGVDARPENHATGVCIKFNTPATYVGINWGGPGDRTKSLRAFSDENCQNYLSDKPIVAPARPNADYWDPKKHTAIGTNTCVPQKLKWGDTWKSVMYYDTVQGLDLGVGL